MKIVGNSTLGTFDLEEDVKMEIKFEEPKLKESVKAEIIELTNKKTKSNKPTSKELF